MFAFLATPISNLIHSKLMSLRGATLAATKQSKKVGRNGLLRRLTPSRNDGVMLIGLAIYLPLLSSLIFFLNLYQF
ncbi:hypothetical protein, partial [Candidatus Tisiphia endosymbiont of Xenochironomus xenolabis]|uniref:hypothetical protein n=1 Tax=Candidatus Tisiphia endosymbiont of Xenochironomus xenolabis TaxID=3139334 RepID=UPI0035C8E9AF